MDIEQIIAESLLIGCVATLRGTHALLAYWRAWRHIVPRESGITEAALQDLEAAHIEAQEWGDYELDPVTNDYIWIPGPDMRDEIATWHRRRAIWTRIEAILDQPDATAIDALYALVNGPDSTEIEPFFIAPSFIQPPKGPVYVAYMKHFYRPYTRHVKGRQPAQNAAAEKYDAIAQ